MIAPRPWVWVGRLSPCGDPGTMDSLGSVIDCCEPSKGGSGALNEGALESAGGSPGTV